MLANPEIGMFVEGLYGRCGVITKIGPCRASIDGRYGCDDFTETFKNLFELPTIDEIYERAKAVRKARGKWQTGRKGDHCQPSYYTIPEVRLRA